MNKKNIITLYVFAFILVLSFVSYKAFTVPLPTRAPDEQKILNAQVPHATPGPPPSATAVGNGEALAYIQIPRFGEDWFWTALEGTDTETINKGPGHFSSTELPGEEGNSVFAAHRASHGDPFLDFDKLEVGDEVIISQVGAEWRYEVKTLPEVIEPEELWILDDFEDGKWLTLTTCWPRYGSSKRLFIRAELLTASTR